MVPAIKNYLANQARKPSGWFGRIVSPLVFNHENSEMEDYGLRLMNPKKDDKILEIGFGNGRLLSNIMPYIETGKVSGIDVSDQMVSLAIKNNRHWINYGKLDIKKASISNIPYPDNSFDKVFTANTIYFWPEPRKNLREIKRVLKPGGSIFCVMRLEEQMKSKNSIVEDNPEVFQNLYSKHEVEQLFKNADCHNVEVHSKSGNKENIYVITGTFLNNDENEMKVV